MHAKIQERVEQVAVCQVQEFPGRSLSLLLSRSDGLRTPESGEALRNDIYRNQSAPPYHDGRDPAGTHHQFFTPNLHTVLNL